MLGTEKLIDFFFIVIEQNSTQRLPTSRLNKLTNMYVCLL